MNAETIPSVLKDALQAEPSVAAGIVFGSVARGTARPDSDLDLALLYRDEAARRASGDDLIGLLGRLGVVAGRAVHLVDLQIADAALVRRIHAEGRVVLDRSAGGLTDLFARRLIEYFDWQYAREVVDADQVRRLGV